MAYDVYGNYYPDGIGDFLKKLFKKDQSVNYNVGNAATMLDYGAGDASIFGVTGTPGANMTGSIPLSSAYSQTRPSIPSQFSLRGTSMRPGYENWLRGEATTANEQDIVSGAVPEAAKTALGAAAGLNPYIAAGTLGLGAIQTIGGLIGLATTKEPKGYELTPKLKSAIGEAETAARFGLGAPQLALARQQGREAINTQMYNARNLSPNMASILGRMNVGTSLSAANQLAAQDFAAQEQKRKYRDAMYAQEQEIADRNVALAQQRYQQKQAAYGGAMQSGLTNLGSYFNLAAALNYKPNENPTA